LDWGLGHATRCIPIIQHLLSKGCKVLLAAEGKPAQLLRENFPDLIILPLEGYRVHYSKHKWSFSWKIMEQVPKILSAINRERTWLHDQHAQHQFDLVISDNRYGLKIPALRSIIMTHQLQIQSGKGAWINRLIQRLHYRFLSKFDECWVVDHEGERGIGGALSQPNLLPSRARYIGLLSQLSIVEKSIMPSSNKILVLLSGPEPMRQIFEEQLLAQMVHLPQYEWVVVAGNPSGPTKSIPHGRYYTHLPAVTLAPIMAEAALVICRSGYSTLMDIAAVGGKALLVPTPGQTEQEYLGQFLQQKGIFYSVEQGHLSLERDINRALQYAGLKDEDVNNKMKQVVDDLLATL
jgi:predicted glycosyltransferase